MRSLVLFLCLCSLKAVHGQKEGHNWYFGINAGITFHTDPPSALLNGRLSSNEGCASISTAEGRLLFYTDGIIVYDSTHNFMPNGVGLNGHSSSTQSAIVVQRPDSQHIYYIFTVDHLNNKNGLQYSEVNLRLNSGKGDVVPGRKNIMLTTPVCEKLTAVQHGNGYDYWVVATRYKTDSFFAYRVTRNGVSSTPVISTTGFKLMGVPTTAQGQLKISPNGQKIAYTAFMYDSCAIGDFDPYTGKLSNVWPFRTNDIYGVEFSPNSRYLYLTVVSGFGGNELLQYEANAGSLNDLVISKKIIDYTIPIYFASLQLGPDGKIYIAELNDSSISVIHAPDSAWPYNRVQRKAVALQRKSLFGLPSYIQSFFRDRLIVVKKRCLGDSTLISLSHTEQLDSVKWDLGDPGSGSANYPVSTKVIHQYPKTGTYTVVAVTYRKLRVDTIKHTFLITHVKPELPKDTFLCNNFSLGIKPRDLYAHYLWLHDSSSASSVTVKQKGNYILQVIDDNGCIGKDTMKVDNPRVLAGFLMSDTLLCMRDKLLKLTDTSILTDESRQSSSWYFGDGGTASNLINTSRSYGAVGKYEVKLVVKGSHNCIDSISKSVKLIMNGSTKILINSDTQCLQANSFAFLASGVSRYKWDLGDNHLDTGENPVHSYVKPGPFRIKLNAYDSANCPMSDSADIYVALASVQASVNSDTLCLSDSFSFAAGAGKLSYNWSFGDGQLSSVRSPKHGYAQPGTYKVTLMINDSFYCGASDTLDVHVKRNAVAGFDLHSDTVDCGLQMFYFNSSSLYYGSLEWLIDGKSFNTKQVEYEFQNSDSFTIRLIAIDSGALCPDTLEKKVSVQGTAGKMPLIPNVFTPGKDGVNDCYMLGGLSAECNDKSEIWIYNRWGLQVFHGDILEDCWNGRLNNDGEALSEGVYFYIMKLSYSNKGVMTETSVNGVIHLIR